MTKMNHEFQPTLPHFKMSCFWVTLYLFTEPMHLILSTRQNKNNSILSKNLISLSRLSFSSAYYGGQLQHSQKAKCRTEIYPYSYPRRATEIGTLWYICLVLCNTWIPKSCMIMWRLNGSQDCLLPQAH